ncbi:MAG: hypothetical protein AABW50_04200 [Nanoarchaeota archaeon]
MEYDSEKREIKLDRELSNLDKFAIEFTETLGKHVDYVIVAGYISILLGRVRITEDIDVFIRRFNFEEFLKLYEDLRKNGFWCINAEKDRDIFNYLKDGLAVRFSYEGTSLPNFEVKFPKDELDEQVFGDFITVVIHGKKLIISSLERNIAFKRYFLGSDKDIEDAIHLEKMFKGQINNEKINKVKALIEARRKWKIKKV